MLAHRLPSAAHAAKTTFSRQLVHRRLDQVSSSFRLYIPKSNLQRATMATSDPSISHDSKAADSKPPGPETSQGTPGMESYIAQSLAISEADDDPEVRAKYRPFVLDPHVTRTDWVYKLELDTATAMARRDYELTGQRLRILVLYGSLRER